MSEPQIRATATQRRVVEPVLAVAPTRGYAPADEYVRRFWIAVLGPGAVADLLRLTAAAQSGRSLKEPVHLPALLASGLVIRVHGSVMVNDTVPAVPAHLVRRMPPALRSAHAQTVPVTS